jgi:transposase
LHAAQLNEWIDIVSTAALAGLAPQSHSKAKKSPQEEKIQELEKELNRKDKALAEVTAILALKKRIREIWGDGDDDTGTRSGT